MIKFAEVKAGISQLEKISINGELCLGRVKVLDDGMVEVQDAQAYESEDQLHEIITTWAANYSTGTLDNKAQILGGGSLTRQSFNENEKTIIESTLVAIEFKMEGALDNLIGAAIMGSICNCEDILI